MKYNRSIFVYLGVIFCLSSLDIFAGINVGQPSPAVQPKSLKALAEDCNPATAVVELNINNIRARIMSGGDMWWDLNNNPRYEVPKVDPTSGEIPKHSLFAGALWIGGFDALGQLKVAAQTYRQTGNDFFPGPLNDNGQIEKSVCSDFDKFFTVLGADITDFKAKLELNGGTLSASQIPESILKWPGKDNPYFDEFQLPAGKNLAPYWEATPGENSYYDPTTGDYPVIDSEIEDVYADQMIWWIFNDMGDVHTETSGQQIGLEVNSLAFAYSTNDEVNNMTFYKYYIDNKSTADLDSVYFGQWVDADLGKYDDDFVGCVVEESLGIIYNGDAVDEGVTGYGENPPLLGIDFFQGPKDEFGVELGMSGFVYYNIDPSPNGNPATADHFYGYLAGVWKDKTPFTYGGNAYQSSDTPTAYMFPSDPSDCSPNAWSECNSNGGCEQNDPNDRRFLQVSGPFKLKPGAINEVIIGAVWVRDGVQYPCPSFEPLKRADAKAQALFDNNFKLLSGPNAPCMTIRELDRELIISIWNPTNSNNYNESYTEADPILAGQGFRDSLFRFQGYKIFQTNASNISAEEYNDPSKAKLVAVVDIEKDGVERIINWIPDPELGFLTANKMVDGNDLGIRHTFKITEDLFATGDKSLINNKRYYFTAIAYAHNSHEPYNSDSPSPTAQLTPYLEGRKNIKIYTAIPHIVAPQNGGIVLNSSYGDGPEITQIEGVGNGGFEIELSPESLAEVLANGSVNDPIYASGAGPIQVNIYDPMLVPDHKFRLELTNSNPFEIVSGPFFGTTSIDLQGNLSYTLNENPGPDYLGIDHLIYRVFDSHGNSDVGVVTFEIQPNGIIGIVACPVSIEHVINPTANPTVPKIINLQDAVYTSIGDWEIIDYIEPLDGEVSITGPKEITYKPLFGRFNGVDIFSYIVQSEDGNFIDTAQVYVYVKDDSFEPSVKDDQFSYTAGMQVDVLENDIIYEVYDNSTFATEEFNTPYVLKNSKWILTDLNTGKVYHSANNISINNEEAIGGWQYDDSCEDIPSLNFYCYETSEPLGFTINVRQVSYPHLNDNFISSKVSFSNIQQPWLSFINDEDGTVTENWILAGNFSGGSGNIFNDYIKNDPYGYYEQFLDGGAAPFCLVQKAPSVDPESFFTLPISPGCSDCEYSGLGGAPDNTINNLASINLVITNNPEHWTRCAVIEQGRFDVNNINSAKKGALRNSPSLEKDGSAIAGSTGLSYFPGYAIDLETGRRLNIMFGENSTLASENGTDMKWNPTQLRYTESAFSYRMGGEHWIYVMNSTYDNGNEIHSKLSTGDLADKKAVYDQCMWVMTPLLADGYTKDVYKPMSEGLVPSDLTIKLKVAKPYEETTLDQPLIYEFDLGKYKPEVGSVEAAVSALDVIRVVPNPYYAYSEYENDKFDNTVKITNLPDYAKIKIFTLDGSLIRNLEIDNRGSSQGTSLVTKDGNIDNSIDWDMKNNVGVPVASGVYIIHVEAPDLGEERVLKWFGIMRPIDLETF